MLRGPGQVSVRGANPGAIFNLILNPRRAQTWVTAAKLRSRIIFELCGPVAARKGADCAIREGFGDPGPAQRAGPARPPQLAALALVFCRCKKNPRTLNF